MTGHRMCFRRRQMNEEIPVDRATSKALDEVESRLLLISASIDIITISNAYGVLPKVCMH